MEEEIHDKNIVKANQEYNLYKDFLLMNQNILDTSNY